MDVHSLPDEMLGNVVKYTSFSEGRKLRMLDKRIDRIAKRENIHTTVTITKFQISDTKILIQFGVFESMENPQRIVEIPCNPIPESIEQWLRRTTISKEFHIYGRLVPIKLDQEMFSMLRRCRKNIRKNTGIWLYKVEVSLPKKNLRKMFHEFFPLVKHLQLSDSSGMIANILSNEVLGTRIWNSFYLFGNSETSSLDDDFLLNIVPNTNCCFLGDTKANFTANGVFTLLKELSVNNNLNHRIILPILKLGGLGFARADRLFSTEFSGITITYQDENNVRRYTATFEPYRYLTFSLELPS